MSLTLSWSDAIFVPLHCFNLKYLSTFRVYQPSVPTLRAASPSPVARLASIWRSHTC